MKMSKPKFWKNNDKTILSLLFYPLSLLIKLLFTTKNLITKKKETSIPVICVGNIYIGGTGKTPLTIKIHELIKKQKKNPAIIKKYYKNQKDEINLISDKTNDIFVDKSRFNGINNSIKKGYKIAILDDGLQDLTIEKDLSIVCFNSYQLIGNGLTIPAGPLRESLSSINKYDMIVINGLENKDFEKKITGISGITNIFYTNYFPTNAEKFKNKKMLAFAGIGNPENFFRTLEKNAITIEKKLAFPDHYNYSKKDIAKIKNMAKDSNLEIITTEKDYFRMDNLYRNEINYLSIEVKISDENNFLNEINKYL
ncbi:tetraacyldisaccharide 4'-kinase [Pelagibacteraceae bacterium]|jgi:tetraacyldisaccharide 4'-kinase|nr:tetraacyldisaccharide 4'-kinase [Pelagibacteraceae bacterium]|tara:strand:+ start:197 stop:1129 length:933 start_codon:yes stop_codon:yes gene_type:complete